MSILITGSSGFIGKNLLLGIRKEPEIIATYNTATDFPAFLKQNALQNVMPMQIDLACKESISKIIEISPSFDLCIFLAANGDPAVSVDKPAFDLTSNTITLINLLENISFSKFIYFSSGAVYDGLIGPVSPESKVNPKLPYAISNLASEKYLQYYRHASVIKEFVTVRFFGAYGPHEPPRKIFSRLVKRFGIEKNPRFTIRGDGKNLINAMYIDDAIRGVQLLINNKTTKDIIDLHADNSMTLTQLVEKAAEVFDLKAEICYEKSVPEYIQFYSIDSYMRDSLNFNASTGIKEGLMNLCRFLDEHCPQNNKKLYREFIS